MSEAYEKMKKKTSESFFKASETLKSKFSKVKEEVEDFIPAEVDRSKASWSLDFATQVVTVTY